jgi:uncharacterized repeat protein (TIGR03803 family)
LLHAADGNFYGITNTGGEGSCGVVFELSQDTTTGDYTSLQVLYSFPGTNPSGCQPFASLIQASDGNLYGTTNSGGDDDQGGIVFELSKASDGLFTSYTLVHSFCGTCKTDGSNPWGPLFQASDGNLYGETTSGGTADDGVIYELSKDADGQFTVETVLHNFGVAIDGVVLDAGGGYGGLIQAKDGNLYGTTRKCVYQLSKDSDGNFTVFTVLHTFTGPSSGGSDGIDSDSGLVQGTDGNLYGTTQYGGTSGEGTVYAIIPDPSTGKFTGCTPMATGSEPCQGYESVLYNFPGGSDGGGPYAPLIRASDGNYYGTAPEVVFELSRTGQTGVSSGYFDFTPIFQFTDKVTQGFDPRAGLVQVGGFFYSGTFIGGPDSAGSNCCGVLYSLTGPAAPAVSLSPTSLTFASQNLGTTSAAQTVTLKNTGSATLMITSITPSAGFGETNTCGTSVDAGNSCTINVTFAPTSPGAATGSITITDNASGSPQAVSLKGTGVDDIEVTLSPASAKVALGGKQVFTATISNATNTALKWYVNGVLNGSAAEGTLTGCTTVAPLTCTYTAPPVNVPSPNPAVIEVASVEDSTKTKTASVTVTDTIAVTLSPASKSLALGGTQLFTATISNTTNTALNWYVNGVLNGNATQGKLTGTGLTRTYTAPPVDVPSPNPAVIEVASVADPSKYKTATVTVTDSIAVTLSPASESLALGGKQVFTATLSGTTNSTLYWYVNGVLNGSAAQGTLTACTTVVPRTCTYTAPPVDVPSPNPAVIKVASAADPSKYKTANVTVTDSIAVTLSPTSKSLALGGKQVFTATLTGTTNTALDWYVNGVLNGNATQGTLTACTSVAPRTCTYTAPPVNVPGPNPAVIKVASAADPGKFETASVTVTDSIAVTLSPTSKSLALGGKQVFTATLTGTTNTALDWYVNGVLNGNATQGTLTACTTVAPRTCTYTAPPVNLPSPNPVVIKVASAADPSKSKTADVTVTKP